LTIKIEKEFSYSAILTTYNAKDTVADALRSILQQSVKPNEIIIVDDCSTDSTIEVIRNTLKTEDGYKLVRNSSNLGQSVARNLAAEIATGDVLVIFDDDDISHPSRASCHIKMHLGGADLSFISSIREYPGKYQKPSINREVKNLVLDPKLWARKLLGGDFNTSLDNLWIPASTCAVSKEKYLLLGGYDPSFRRVEDAELFIRAANCRMIASWNSEILVNRRATFSSDKGGKIDSSFEMTMLHKHRSLFSNREYKKLTSLIRLRALYFQREFLSLFKELLIPPKFYLFSLRRILRVILRIIQDRKVK
jgi:glycosyltransferase involved in cell wall biosynthesis